MVVVAMSIWICVLGFVERCRSHDEFHFHPQSQYLQLLPPEGKFGPHLDFEDQSPRKNHFFGTHP
jgi:hypothetical protein